MKHKNWIWIAVVVLLLILSVTLAVRLISGAFHLVQHGLDTVLGIVLILALLILVAWMFLYASKKRKK